MTKILATALALFTCIPALAHGPHGTHRHHPVYPSRHLDWVAPAIIGGAVVYGLTRPNQAQPPVIVQNGLPTAPPGYRYEMILDAHCNCYRTVLVPL